MELVLIGPSSSTGVICVIDIFGTHHNPSVWPDPEVMPPPHPTSIIFVHSPLETQGGHRVLANQTSLPPHYKHICLSKDGRPGRYHPATLSCLAPRSMTPSASTQKTSKGGHLWLLFPSQQVPGEDIGHLRWECGGGGGSIWD